MNNIGAIILAAGKGKRMRANLINKVALPLGNKQMILHAVDKLKELNISPIIAVVGFAKKSVMDILYNKVTFVEQKKRLGTAHAVLCALKKIPENVNTVLVVNGDDSAFYSKAIIKKFINVHLKRKPALSFLTITVDNPSGLGRIIRNNDGNLLGIVEEKDATQKQKRICEINPGCYVFEIWFLKKYLKKIKKSQVSGEYYLTSLIDLAVCDKEKINTVKCGRIPWRGINTQDELTEAEELFLNLSGGRYENKN